MPAKVDGQSEWTLREEKKKQAAAIGPGLEPLGLAILGPKAGLVGPRVIPVSFI